MEVETSQRRGFHLSSFLEADQVVTLAGRKAVSGKDANLRFSSSWVLTVHVQFPYSSPIGELVASFALQVGSFAQRHAMLWVEPLEKRRLLTALTIAQENQLPGSPESQWFFDGTASTAIEGYATQMSVDHGQTIQFKVNTKASAYRLDIYRMGYYGGLGAREVASIHPALYLPQGQPAPIVDASAAHDSGSAGLVDAGNWLVTASWDVPPDATSGIYFAKLEREDGGSGTNYIVFVVRDDEGNSDLLFKTSDETWQAYNNWGNSSLYGPDAGAMGRSFKVSYNRPLVQAFGGELDVFDQEHSMVDFLESNGYDVSYTSAIDVAMNPSALLHHKVFLSVGHDEYWSGAERANIEAARDGGLSLIFASGNEMFWKTYWANSLDASHTPGRTLVCYKETHDNAITDPVNPNVWTGTWRDLASARRPTVDAQKMP